MSCLFLVNMVFFSPWIHGLIHGNKYFKACLIDGQHALRMGSLGGSIPGAELARRSKLIEKKMHGEKDFRGLNILKIHESKNETKTLLVKKKVI